MYAPEHWSGSCRTCRTGCCGPAINSNHYDVFLWVIGSPTVFWSVCGTNYRYGNQRQRVRLSKSPTNLGTTRSENNLRQRRCFNVHIILVLVYFKRKQNAQKRCYCRGEITQTTFLQVARITKSPPGLFKMQENALKFIGIE